MALRQPPARIFGAHARYCMAVRPLLWRHHGFELEILFYYSHRFLNRDYTVPDCCGMAFSEANPKPLGACRAGVRAGNTKVTGSYWFVLRISTLKRRLSVKEDKTRACEHEHA